MKPHDDHKREHVHIHAQHYEKDPGSGRMWLFGGIALLIVAIVYSAVLISHSRAKSATGSNLELVQMQFDPSHDNLGIAVGPADAKVVVREFADYQCPPCAGFEPVLQQMRKEYVDTGKVRFIFFDFPREGLHKNAVMAAQFARCAADQNKFWQMHDQLYTKQADWADLKDPMNAFLGYGDKMGLDGNRMLACMRTGSTHQDVVRSEAYGEAMGFNATPSFAVNDQATAGGVAYADLKNLIDQQLAAPKP